MLKKFAGILTLICLLAVPALAAGITHISWGIISGAATGDAWTFYVVARPTEKLTGTANLVGGSFVWQAQVGNLPSAWNNSDDSLAFAKREINPGANNHAGYYAVINEDLSTITNPQKYNDMTIRQVPVPTATGAAGAVNLSWTAAQTDASKTPHGNNVAGYNVYRSTSQSTGFTKINASLVSATNYSDPTGTIGTTYYYAIEPVFRGTVSLGVYSANSNGAAPQPVPFDFSLSVNPAAATIQQGNSGTAEVTASLVSGSTASVALSASGQPTGVTIGFAPTSINPTAKSTMTVNVGGAVATGSYPITITGTGGATTHITTYTLTVSPATPPVTPITLTYDPSRGNIFWVSVPYNKPYVNASNIVADINVQNGLPADSGQIVTSIGRWTGTTDPQAQESYDFLDGLGWNGTNFNMVTGDAVYLNIAQTTTFTLKTSNDPNFVFNLPYDAGRGNIFWVSLPYNGNFTDVTSIIADINTSAGLPADSGTLVTSFGRWVGSTQAQESYDFLDGLGWNGTNFSYNPGDGYYINLAGTVDKWKPKVK